MRSCRNAPTTSVTPTATAATASAIDHGMSTPQRASAAEDRRPRSRARRARRARAGTTARGGRAAAPSAAGRRCGSAAADGPRPSRAPESEQRDPGERAARIQAKSPCGQRWAWERSTIAATATSASPISRHGRSRCSRSASSTIDSSRPSSGITSAAARVDQEPGAAEQREHDEPDAVEGGVDVEVAAEAAADAGDHPVRPAPAELSVCGVFCHVLQRAARLRPASIRQTPGPTLQSTRYGREADHRQPPARHDYQLLDRVEAGHRADRHRGQVAARRPRDARRRPTPTSATARCGCTAPRSRSTTRATARNHEPTRLAQAAPAPPRDRPALRPAPREGADARPDEALLQGRPRQGRAGARARQGRARQAPHRRRPRREAADRARIKERR